MAAPLMFALFNCAARERRGSTCPRTRCERIDTCANDGYPRDRRLRSRSAPGCRATATSTRSVLTTCACNLDADGKQRVDGDCESPSADDAGDLVRVAARRGVLLPPRARRIPAAAGAARGLSAPRDRWPRRSRCCIRIRIRRCSSRSELDGQRGRTVFEAVSRRREATIYWHLDGQYLGETHTFHQQSLDIDPGEHILTVVDDEGERVARRFQVIATRKGF